MDETRALMEKFSNGKVVCDIGLKSVRSKKPKGNEKKGATLTLAACITKDGTCWLFEGAHLRKCIVLSFFFLVFIHTNQELI